MSRRPDDSESRAPGRGLRWVRRTVDGVYFSMAGLAILIGATQGHIWTGLGLGLFVAMLAVKDILFRREITRGRDLTTAAYAAASVLFVVAALTDTLALLAMAGLSAFKAWADRDYFAGQEVRGALRPGPKTGDR
jgi:hypothetical protein